MRPSVTVVIPCLDAESTIAAAVRSCLEQSETPDRIVCVDDGSTDGTVDTLAALAEEHSSLLVLHNETRLGPGGSRNRGLAAAESDLILFLDADDRLRDGALETVVELMGQDDLDLLMFSADQMSKGQRYSRTCSYRRAFAAAEGRLLTAQELRASMLEVRFAPWHKAYRRSFLTEHAIAFPERVYYEDLPFHIECFARAQRVRYVDRVLYVNERRRPGSITTEVSERTLTAWESFDVAERLIAEHWPADDDLRREFLTYRIEKMLDYIHRIPVSGLPEHFERLAELVSRDHGVGTRTFSLAKYRHIQRLLELPRDVPQVLAVRPDRSGTMSVHAGSDCGARHRSGQC